MSYDDPNILVQREHHIQVLAAGGGNHRFRQFQEIRITNVKWYVAVKGTATGATDNQMAVGVGTSTAYHGTIAYGTNAIGFLGTLALNTTLTAAEPIRLDKGTDAVGEVDLVIEYQIDND